MQGTSIELNNAMNTSSTQLTVNDLAEIKDIINLACTRGAFRANEMRTVGAAYDKIVAFLSDIVSQAQTSEQGNTDLPNGENE